MDLLFKLAFFAAVVFISEYVFRRPAEHLIFGERESTAAAPSTPSRWSWLGWVGGFGLLATPLLIWLYRRYC